MRRQYHPHKIGDRVHIWDVLRLVDLSLDSIREMDQQRWFEENDPLPTCRAVAFHAKLIEETDLKHPIILGEDGRVMDGMHRVCKAWMRGLKTIKAVRFEKDPEPDHVDASLEDLSYEEPW